MSTQPTTVIDKELLNKGREVLMLSGLASTAVEAQVVRWREELKAPLDWHYSAGRAVVMCMPSDYARVAAHIHGFRVGCAAL